MGVFEGCPLPLERGRGLRRRLAFLALAFAVACSGPARALDPQLDVVQYKHTRWTAAEGAPPLIYALAQGRDGFLWVGSGTGLYRFDGVTFEHIPAPEADAQARRVSALLAAHDGAIWVGYDSGHLAVYRDGALHDVSTDASDVFVMRLLQRPDGVVWAMLGRPNQPLMRRIRGRWEALGPDWGLPEGWLIDAIVARDGALWVTTLESILVLRRGSRRFERVGAAAGHAAISQDPDGAVWISDDLGSRMIERGARPASGRTFPTPGALRAVRALFDRDGNLWGANGRGLYRVRTPASSRSAGSTSSQVERFTAAEGLSSDTTIPLLEDREGNIWIGTTLGLDRLRTPRVVVEPRIADSPQFGFALLGASDGNVYVAANDALYRVPPGGRPDIVAADLSDARVICEGPDGVVWAFYLDRLLRVEGSLVSTHAAPAEPPQTCAVDDRNVLWANAQRAGLFRRTGERWQHHPVEGDGWVMTMAMDRGQGLLLAMRSGEIVRADSEGRPRRVVYEVDRIAALQAIEHAVFAGSPLGLARIDDRGPRLLTTERFPWIGGPSGIVRSPTGTTWILGNAGIVGVGTAALARAFEDPDARLQPIVLGFADGLPNVQNRGATDTAALGGDGRIWFAVSGHVVWIDPRRMVPNPLPPPVAIRALVADGRRHRDPDLIRLDAGVSSVSIEYTALSLIIPEHVRFRYRLEGAEREWIDSGARREVSYSNLGPGTYRFRVIAANNDGLWNEEGAVVEFTIPPTFLQSIWFKFLIALAALGLLWAAYALRVRQVAAGLQRRFEIRVAERERIARELHDTLLQGLQGLMLRFQSVANRLPSDSDVRGSLDDAMDRADEVLVEGRARVRDLRARSAEGDLAKSIVEIAHNEVAGDRPRFQLTVEGEPRALHALVHEELLRIAEEAIRNAARHADADAIEAILSFGRSALRLAIRDDGTGLPEAVATRGERAGHYGLLGIRERAQRIGGRLELTSRKGAGTQVALLVPGRAAYKDRRRRLLDRIFRPKSPE